MGDLSFGPGAELMKKLSMIRLMAVIMENG